MTDDIPQPPVIDCALHGRPMIIPDDYPEPAVCLACEAWLREEDASALRRFDEARLAGRRKDALNILRPFRR